MRVLKSTYRWSELNDEMLNRTGNPSVSNKGAILLRVFWSLNYKIRSERKKERDINRTR